MRIPRFNAVSKLLRRLTSGHSKQPQRVESRDHLAYAIGVVNTDLHQARDTSGAFGDIVERKRKDQFAADLEQAAMILRDGTTSELAEFASRNTSARAEAAAARIRSKH